MFTGLLAHSGACALTEMCRKPTWPSSEAKRKILSDVAGAGRPLRSAQWSFIVLLSSMMRQGRRQWRISEQRHMSGSESVDRSVLERPGVIVMGLRAADTQPRTLHGSTHTEERADCVY